MGQPASSFVSASLPTPEAVEAALIRARKMQSLAFYQLLSGLGRAGRRAVANMRRRGEMRRAARALRQMDRHLLADIGLAPGEIERAVSRGRPQQPLAAAGRPANDDLRAPREVA